MDKSKTHNRLSDEERLAKEVLAHPSFQAMAKQKALVGWSFSAVIFFVYVAFIWVVGTHPQLLGAKVSADGVTTWGIYIGMFVIVFSFVITLVYVHIANGRFENITREVVREVQKKEGAS